MEDITRMLAEWNKGDELALDQIIQSVYAKLRELAHRELNREFHGSGMQTTELLNEAYLLLAEKHGLRLDSRQHFFNMAALAMRRYLLDQAKRRHALRRGGDLIFVPNEGDAEADKAVAPETIILINSLLDEMEKKDPLLVQVTTMRYFAGFTVNEIAECLEIAPITVKRKWQFAKAWLEAKLREQQES